MRQFFLIWGLLLGCVAGRSSPASAAANARMENARRINRAFQVELGRSMAPAEARDLLNQGPNGPYLYMKNSPELRAVYVERLSRFVKGRLRNSPPTRQMQARMNALAEPDKPIGPIMDKVAEGRHGGRLCLAMDGGVCFARWLARAIAPGYGIEWVRARQDQVAQMTYAQLVEGLAKEGASL